MTRAAGPRRILLAVSGSISAYKSADLVSLLRKQGCEVQVLMTESAAQFITPVTLETLSLHPVHLALFGPGISGTEHIRLARWADVIVFAPATAHLLAKLSLGLADDLITTVALATEAPWVVAPAMNTVMWEQPVTQSHVRALEARGVRFIEPESGVLACGEEGAGKLASPETIVEAVLSLPLSSKHPDSKEWAGERLLITAGPTISPIDAVRYITNPSTGKMGAALAQEALARGAAVDYVLGIDKGVIEPRVSSGEQARFRITRVRTAQEMLEAALRFLPEATGVIATAAVMDYQVVDPSPQKLKRSTASTTLELIPSVDVLGSLRANARDGQWFFGFAAESENLEENGRKKLAAKKLDYLFANRIAKLGETVETGFGSDRNAGILLHGAVAPGGIELRLEEIPLSDKSALARRLLESVLRRSTDVRH